MKIYRENISLKLSDLEKKEDVKEYLKLTKMLKEADRAYDLFEQKSETEARPHAGKLRPAGKPGDRFTEAITQRRDESDHNIIERKQFSHLFPARSFKDSKRAV